MDELEIALELWCEFGARKAEVCGKRIDVYKHAEMLASIHAGFMYRI